jgi:hypothetical protein
VPDLARVRAVGDVVDLDAAREIDRALAPHPGMEQLVVDQHDVAVHPHLVRMGVRRQRHLADDARPARVLNIDDRGALRRVHVADKGMAALGGDLAAARNVEPGEMAKQRGQLASPPITWTSRR